MTLMTFCNPRIQKIQQNDTKVALQTLTAYIIEADKDVNLCDCSPEQLAEILRNFYIDVRKKDGTSYKLSALKSIPFCAK